jgi:serine/threonine-protein kinase
MEPSRVRVGDVIEGKYRVERILGQGGMGVVVAARHLALDELFAIKLLLPAVLGDATAVERFLREARATARLKSEHVVRVNDVGRLPDGVPYLVMELLSGQDLAQILAERGPLPPAEAITYVLQACDAVGEAHVQGFVHRDLKPANLFRTHRLSGQPLIKVVDFGISKQMDPTSPAMTKTSAVMGTPYYMSPEQMRSSKSADARTDIWAFGVILYELVTATLPFDGESATEIVARVLSEEPPPPSRRVPIPLPLEQVILSCLVRDPARRYQSVPQLVQALGLLMQDPTIVRWPAPARATLPRGPSVPPTAPDPATGEMLARGSVPPTAPSGPPTPSWRPMPPSGPTSLQAPMPPSGPTSLQAPMPPSAQPTSLQHPSWPPPSGWPAAGPTQPQTTAPGAFTTGAVQLPAREPPRASRYVVPAVAVLFLGAAGGGGFWWMTGRSSPRPAATVEAPATAAPTAAPAKEANPWIAVTLPAGKSVVLGLPSADDEEAMGFRPARGITAPAVKYEIQQHEVTWGELEPWLDKNAALRFERPAWTPAERQKLPATGVPWETARQYCHSLGGQLPTEEEWEYAARGAELRPHPWGNPQVDLLRTRAFVGMLHKGKPKKGAPAVPVVAAMSSDQDVTPEGIHDLAGNALEWTGDLFRESAPGLDEAWVQEGGRTFRAIRGLPLEAEPPARLPAYSAAYRDALCATGACPPATKDVLQYVGFRCARRLR